MSQFQHRAIDQSVESALSTWAAQRRRILDTNQPIPCVIGRLRDQGPGIASPGVPRQRYPSVYSGDGLVVQRILLNVSEMPRLVIAAHYVLRQPFFVRPRTQAEAIGIRLREYWQELEKGEEAISTGLKLAANSLPLLSAGFPRSNWLTGWRT